MLSAKAAQRCLEVLQASLLKDDAEAKKRLLTPIPSDGRRIARSGGQKTLDGVEAPRRSWVCLRS